MPLRRLHLLLLVAAACTAAPAALLAQRVYWEPDHGTLGFGKTSQLSLVFDNCRPSGDVALPAVDGLEFGAPSIQQSTNMVGTRISVHVELNYPVRPQRRGAIVIPAFDVATDKGRFAVGEVRFEIGDAVVGPAGASIDEIVRAELRLPKTTVWIGEVFDVEFTLVAVGRYNVSIADLPQWKPAGLVFEPFAQPERIEVRVGTEQRPGIRFRTRALATQPGRLQLDAVAQRVHVRTGESTGFLLSQPRIEEFSLASERPELTVRALPAPAPAGFTGAVGTFTLESKVVPEAVRVGEPVTWTLTLQGTGNWPANPGLPQREISTDFHVVQPQTRQQMEPNQLFVGALTEDAVLVPTKAGRYTIGPVPFAYFDTASGSYRETPIAAVTIAIQSPLAPAGGGATDVAAPDRGTTAPASANGGDSVTAPPLPDDLTAPSPLPRAPIEREGSGWIPFSGAVGWWLPLALLPPLLTWLALAWRQMWRTDSAHARRQAQRALARLGAAWGKSRATPEAAALLEWRRLVACAWGVPRATPTADDLAAALAVHPGTRDAAAWTVLWREAEAALFAAGAALPSDWTTRARHAATNLRVRRAGPPLPLRAQHWAPRSGPAGAGAALLALALLAPPAPAADAAARAYHEGDFATARTLWEGRITRNPRDWAAHNNLGLTFAQDNRWPEAAAHWTAAFLLHPRDATIRANLRLALARLDGVDPALRRLVEGSMIDRAVATLAPAEWQFVIIAGALAIGGGLVLLVLTLYRPRTRGGSGAGIVVAVAGVVASLAGFSATARYGPLAEPTAGLVARAGQLRSIPSDLAEHQQTSPIAPGTVVVGREAFLTWDRVETGRASTGWIRRDSVIPFFRAPVAPTTATTRM